MEGAFRCGRVTLIGRTNVGKSTLMNRLLGAKISIVSHKSQTTRERLVGIKTTSEYQIIFIDTPGFSIHGEKWFSEKLRQEAIESTRDVALIVFVIEAPYWRHLDRQILDFLYLLEKKPLLLINKIDLLPTRSDLLPLIDKLSKQFDFADIVPVSARRRENLQQLEAVITNFLPVSPPVYPEDQLSEHDGHFFAAEFIREKLTRKLNKELPYQLSVTIDSFRRGRQATYISAVIWVRKNSHKKIIIGAGGQLIRQVGEEARKDMGHLFDCVVHLNTRVKVNKDYLSCQ